MYLYFYKLQDWFLRLYLQHVEHVNLFRNHVYSYEHYVSGPDCWSHLVIEPLDTGSRIRINP